MGGTIHEGTNKKEISRELLLSCRQGFLTTMSTKRLVKNDSPKERDFSRSSVRKNFLVLLPSSARQSNDPPKKEVLWKEPDSPSWSPLGDVDSLCTEVGLGESIKAIETHLQDVRHSQRSMIDFVQVLTLFASHQSQHKKVQPVLDLIAKYRLCVHELQLQGLACKYITNLQSVGGLRTCVVVESKLHRRFFWTLVKRPVATLVLHECAGMRQWIHWWKRILPSSRNLCSKLIVEHRNFGIEPLLQELLGLFPEMSIEFNDRRLQARAPDAWAREPAQLQSIPMQVSQRAQQKTFRNRIPVDASARFRMHTCWSDWKAYADKHFARQAKAIEALVCDSFDLPSIRLEYFPFWSPSLLCWIHDKDTHTLAAFGAATPLSVAFPTINLPQTRRVEFFIFDVCGHPAYQNKWQVLWTQCMQPALVAHGVHQVFLFVDASPEASGLRAMYAGTGFSESDELEARRATVRPGHMVMSRYI